MHGIEKEGKEERKEPLCGWSGTDVAMATMGTHVGMATKMAKTKARGRRMGWMYGWKRHAKTHHVRMEALEEEEGRTMEGEDEGKQLAMAMAKAADDTKALDVRVLRVEDVVYWTRYFVLATGRSRPQMEAVAGRMAEAAADVGRTLPSTPRLAEWTVLDYGDVVAHIFSPRERQYYDLETFYEDGEEIDLPWESNTQDYV